MIWTDNRTLTFDGDGPAVLHALSLGTDLLAAVGDKPSVRFLDELIALNFHIDFDAATKTTAESIVAAHNGTAALAADAAVRAQLESDEETNRAAKEALLQKRRDGVALTTADIAQAIDLWLGV